MSGCTARSAPHPAAHRRDVALVLDAPGRERVGPRPAPDQLRAHRGIRAEHGDLDRRVEVREQVAEHPLRAGVDRRAREGREPHGRPPASRTRRPIHPPSRWPIWSSSQAASSAVRMRSRKARAANASPPPSVARMTPGTPLTPWRIAQAASPGAGGGEQRPDQGGEVPRARLHRPARDPQHHDRRQDLGREVRHRGADGVVVGHQHEREREVEHRRDAAREHGRARVVHARQQGAADGPDRERRQAQHEHDRAPGRRPRSRRRRRRSRPPGRSGRRAR